VDSSLVHVCVQLVAARQTFIMLLGGDQLDPLKGACVSQEKGAMLTIQVA
jgi:hypothetical protein